MKAADSNNACIVYPDLPQSFRVGAGEKNRLLLLVGLGWYGQCVELGYDDE